MKHYSVVILIFAFTQACAQFDYRSAEYINHDEEVTIYLEADKESRKSKDKNDFVYRMLKVNMNTETGVTEMLRQELGSGANEKASFKFSEDFISYTKKFVVIQGKTCFYVYDVRNKKLSPEFIPQRVITVEDSVEVIINQIFVSKDGTYLYGTFSGGGSFMYNTCDVKNIFQIPSANNPMFGFSRIYLHKNCETPTLRTALYVAQDDTVTVFKTIFIDRTLSVFPESKLKYSEDEIEESIITEDLNAQRFCIMEESAGKFLVIDVFIGKIYDLPNGKSFATKDELLKYLIDTEEERKQLEFHETDN
jgi:hypothetical protein